MRLRDLMDRIGAEALTSDGLFDVEIDRVYATSRISDILSETTESTLLVTDLTSSHALVAGELAGVPAICFVDGKRPDPATVEKAVRYAFDKALLVSPDDMDRTCARLNACLAEESGKAP